MPRLALVLFLWLALVTSGQAQQLRELRIQLLDSASSTPITTGQAIARGTAIAASPDTSGNLVLLLPSTANRLRAQVIGYEPVDVNVAAEATSLTIVLRRRYLPGCLLTVGGIRKDPR